MILIEYTNEFLEGEPGPNFYWQGIPSDFLQLVVDLHRLGSDNGNELYLNTLNYIQVIEDYNIILRSSKDGRNLCSKNESTIIMDLDKSIWQSVLYKLLGISFERSHDYIEFDDLELEESANIIVSSET
jgi:hypothetical protein